jgi:triphosphatase
VDHQGIGARSNGARTMGQQYELKLIDDPEDEAPPRRRVFRGVPTIIDIEPEPVSRTSVERPRAVKAQPSFLPKDIEAADAYRLTLLQCKWHLTANMPAVVELRDMEGMHQLRVGLRRLRVALASFGGEFRTPQLEAIRLRAKSLANRLAPARDFDVFAEELFEPAATANGALDAFEVLRKRAQAARGKAWDDAVTQVSGHGFRIFMSDLGEAIDRRIWLGSSLGHPHATKGLLAFESPAMKLGDRMLTHRSKNARKRARHLESLSDVERHGLRIALKKLRYTAEFFSPFYEKEQVAKFLARLSRMQDILGALNDVAVARKTLDELVAAGDGAPNASLADVSFAAGIVYGWHLDRAARIWEDAVKRWKRFARTDAFWNTDIVN